MSTSDQSFHDNLDLLIKLLRKMKEKSATGDIPGVPKMFFTNFDFVINNYEMMKNQISDQLLNQFGEPIKEMVADMVNQLKEELSDEIMMDPGFLDEDTDKEEIKEKKDPIILPESLDTSHSIKAIDAKLKNEKLTEAEINELLDLRTRLLKQQADDLNKDEVPF